MIKAVIFDLDGVIVDSEPLHKITENKLLEELGLKEVEHPTGIRFEDILKKASTKNGINIDIKTVMDRKFDIMAESVESIKPIANSIRLINSLSGVKLAIASGSTKNWIDLCLRKFDLGKKFEVVVTSEDIKNAKPDPEPYLLASKKLGINPSDCIAIEDSSTGVKSAKSAGMKCIGYISPHSHNQNLNAADHVVKDLMDAKRFL
ncbi:MAG: HAD family phosphatase [Candidatus Aenigmatarchaeota archaeon]